MLEAFLEDIKGAYSEIIEGRHHDLKALREKWQVKTSLGEVYQSLSRRELKKELGSFYTPYEVVEFMVEHALSGVDLRKTPKIRILDPSCGGGYFLMAALDFLLRGCDDDNAASSIIENNLFGFDIDETAVMITTLELYEKTGRVFKNINCRDFLLENDKDYDIIIGNPPYMGHKVLTGEYRERLYSLYGDVFSDKGDLSYCFIKKSLESLGEGGVLSFFTSRYILEALNGRDIRRYIKESASIDLLVDFYGVRVVKGAGVDNIIITLKRGGYNENIDFFRLREGAKGKGRLVFDDIKNKEEEFSRYIHISADSLRDEGWSFLDAVEGEVLKKIRGVELGSICESFQGIITGCDRAFILGEEEARELNIEEKLLKPWIKSSHIGKYTVRQSEEKIIYTDIIEKAEDFPHALSHIGAFRDRLEKRRECKRGLRKWYELQWGRRPELFEGKKIIYPYKSSSSRFAVDRGSYFSADVYGIIIRDMFKNQYSYEFLTGVLNSRIYEFYVKSMAKKLGEDMYEYYPNKIMTLRIPEFIGEIEEEVLKGGEGLRDRIDAILLDFFGISSREYSAIREWVREDK